MTPRVESAACADESGPASFLSCWLKLVSVAANSKDPVASQYSVLPNRMVSPGLSSTLCGLGSGAPAADNKKACDVVQFRRRQARAVIARHERVVSVVHILQIVPRK